MRDPYRVSPTFSPSVVNHRWHSILIDFGRTVVGMPILTAKGAKGGEIVDITFYETLGKGGLTPDVDPKSWSALPMA